MENALCSLCCNEGKKWKLEEDGALFEITYCRSKKGFLLPYNCKNNSTFRGKDVFNVDLFSTELIIFAGFNG